MAKKNSSAAIMKEPFFKSVRPRKLFG